MAADGWRELLFALGDDEFLLGHRDSEWTGHAPILEEDIAFSNLAQDELGHALLWYTVLHEQFGTPNPDGLAFWRGAPDWRHAIMVELPRGDWAFTIVRQYLFDVYEQVRNAALARLDFEPVRQVVAKISREEVYHLMHSRGWVLRLGDGTVESHTRMQAALDALWPHALGLFEPAGAPNLLPATLVDDWRGIVEPLLATATLQVPAAAQPLYGGRAGRHTEQLDALLADLQRVASSEAQGTIW